MPLFLIGLAFLPPVANLAEERKAERQSSATLVVEYGLDSLERRYYHPAFRFDFPWRGGSFFSQVEYHSRMNGRLQGAIDYWVDVGLRKDIGERLRFEVRLNHFCRHRTVDDTSYVWNLNEVLAGASWCGKNFSLALGAGGFIGGSEGYRQLATAAAEWRGFLFPELSLDAELKLVNLARLYHELGFSLALSRAVDLFFKNTRHYEFRNTSYVGLRFKSEGDSGASLDALKVMTGVSPFHNLLKLEVSGEFRMEFFKNESRRVLLGVGFEAPILNGDGFFSQFWPWKMIYDIGLDYEKKIAPHLFAAWVAQYRLDMPVDDNLPFKASLFTGLALRNQADFDVLENDVRYEVAAGYNFKHGLEAGGRLGLGIWKNHSVKVFGEARGRVDADCLRLDFRLLAAAGRAVEWRPYLGWKKENSWDLAQEMPGKFLFGLGFFKKF